VLGAVAAGAALVLGGFGRARARLVGRRGRPCLVQPAALQHPADDCHAGRVVAREDVVLDELLADLPREGVGQQASHPDHLLLDAAGAGLQLRAAHLHGPGSGGWGGPLAAAHLAGCDAARLGVAAEDLADAAVRDAQLAADLARTHAGRRQLDDARAQRLRQWPPVDEHAAQLVDAPLAQDVAEHHGAPAS